ncbi:RNA-binding protein 4F [Mortierella sp. AM989]|nr:RNA-binding protein 4F [Mortierella sp. AM989]
MGSKDEFSESDDFDISEPTEPKENPETFELISTLKKSLKDNPNQYEQHIQLIALLKDAEMLQELREAREFMKLWMNWIDDESNMATSEDEKKHVLELYERATSDYLSIKIWKSYLDYAIQEYTESMESADNDIVVSREMQQRKLDRHFMYYNISEEGFIQYLTDNWQLPDSPEDVQRVKAMYLKRIAIPHSELESTFSGFSSFISKYDSQDYEESMVQSNKIANATRDLLAKLESFEEKLIATNNSLEAFMSYLDYEQKYHKEQFARIRTLFERAVAVNCLVPQLWNDYLGFLMSSNHQKKEHDLDPAEMLKITTRSVRNCPWSGDLWENYLILLETYLKPDEEVNDILARALSGLATVPNPQELSKVLLASCSYKFRRASKDEAGQKEVREAFEHALAVIEAAGGDPYCRLERLWIEIESNDFGNQEQARKLWKSIESKQKSMSDFWISRADMEKRLNNIKGARHIFVQACNSAETLDWPEKVFDSWLLYERKCGTLPTYKDALIRTRAAMKTVEAFRAQAYISEMPYGVVQPVESSAAADDTRKEEAQAALALHGRDVGERRGLSVQISDTTQKKPRGTGNAPLPLVSRHEVHIKGLLNEIKEEELQKLITLIAEPTEVFIMRGSAAKSGPWANIKFKSEGEANAALALNGTMFQGKELTVTRRVFSKVESNQDQSSRAMKRKHAAEARALAEQGPKDQSVESGAEKSSINLIESTAQSQQGEKEKEDMEGVEELRTSTPLVSSEAKKTSSSPALMKPRSMQPRSLQPRSVSKAYPPRAFTPLKAFKPASKPTVATSITTVQSEGGSDNPEDDGASTSSTTAAEPSAPKSNAEFRTLMLSGALKKKNA